MTSVFDGSGFNFFGNWGEYFGKVFGSLLLLIMQWFCVIVYFIENVFWVLALGVSTENKATGKTEYKSIIDMLLFGDVAGTLKKNSPITNIIIFMMIIGIILTLVALIISVIRSFLSTKDEDNNPKQAVIGVVKGSILIIAVPFLIYMVLNILNTVMIAITEYSGLEPTNINGSLANRFFFMFGRTESNSVSFLDETGMPKFSFLFNQNDIDVIDGILKSKNEPTDDTLFLKLEKIGFLSSHYIDCYAFIPAYIAIIVLAMGLFKCLVLLSKRVFDVTLLYILSPLSIASFPADDGKRYGVWKDLMTAKIVSSLGVTLSFIIYSIFILQLNTLFTKLSPEYFGKLSNAFSVFSNDVNAKFGLTLTIVYIIIVIAGALTLPSAYQMIASLVSESAGRQAQADMSNLQDMHHGLHDVAHLAAMGGHLAKKANKFAFGDSKQGGSGGSGARQGEGLHSTGDSISAAMSNFKNNGLVKGVFTGSKALYDKKHQKDLSAKENALREQALKLYGQKAGDKLNKKLEKMGSKAVTADDRYEYLKKMENIKEMQKKHPNLNLSRDPRGKRDIKAAKKAKKLSEKYQK